MAVSGDGPLTAEDFQRFLQAIEHPDVTSYLSYSTGDTDVSGSQRKQTAEILRKRKLKVALVNDSKVTLGLVSAARWLGLMDMRVFSRAELSSAIAYLDVGDPAPLSTAVDLCCADLGTPRK